MKLLSHTTTICRIKMITNENETTTKTAKKVAEKLNTSALSG